MNPDPDSMNPDPKRRETIQENHRPPERERLSAKYPFSRVKTTRLDEAVDNPEGGSAVRSGGDVAQVPGVPLTFPILR
jgi:hypothetical protein